MDLNYLCSQVCDLSRLTGAFILGELPKFQTHSVETKSLHNFVTYVDKSSEAKLVKELSKLLPEAGFIAEEGTSSVRGERYNWVIDPLDGTTNFIHGLPPFAISIALMDRDEVILGVVHEVISNETFYAWKGSAAYLNGKEIHVSKVTSVKDSLIATGFPYTEFLRIKPFMKSLEYLFTNSHGVRRLGSASVDMAYVACGRFEAFYEYGLSPWDVAAASLIVNQAGGKVSDFREGIDYIFGREIIVGNANIFDEFSRLIREFLAV
jgi:myo-inositol-1(or 4)-monophosphatase